MGIASVILAVMGAYLGIGLLFAIVFVAFGVERVDSAVHGSNWRFRVLILPGSAALWPMLALRWVRAARAGGWP